MSILYLLKFQTLPTFLNLPLHLSSSISHLPSPNHLLNLPLYLFSPIFPPNLYLLFLNTVFNNHFLKHGSHSILDGLFIMLVE